MATCNKCGSDYEEYGQKARMCRPCKRIYDRKYHANRSDEVKRRKLEKQNSRRKDILTKVREYKGELGCKCCDEKEPICLEFHHTNPNEKDFNVADALKSGLSFTGIIREAEKCIVVCSNCHKKIHAGIIVV